MMHSCIICSKIKTLSKVDRERYHAQIMIQFSVSNKYVSCGNI